jgi:predicted chitinase
VWPIAGDFDGDGLDTIGLYEQADATFQVLVDGGVRSAPFALGTVGRADALPVVGDWDGDGLDSVGIYQQADSTLQLVDDEGQSVDPTTVAMPVERPEGATAYDAFPAAGDWDGDGRDTIGILWREADTMELPVPSLDDPAASLAVPTDDVPDMLPVAGDWNGNDLVTIEDLRQIFGPLPDEAKVIEGLPAINAAMLRAGIFTPARKAAFLATLRNESGFRYDAVEVGNERPYRGRGLIQLTGEGNYRNAGQFLQVDLVGNPDLAVNGLVSPAVAAWYWTVARNINMAADQLDMAAVNIAIGYAPSMRRDMTRCGDFIAGLRYFSGGTVPEGVNCARTDASRRLAFSAIVAPATGGRVLPGLPQAPSAPAAGTAPDLSSVPPEWTPPTTSPAPAPVTPTTPPPTAPGTTQPPATTPAPTDPGSTTPPTDGSTSSTTEPSTTSSSTTEPSTTSSSTTEPSGTSGTTSTSSATSTVVPDSTSSTTLFESQYN